ncbi:MAG: GntR family transcriptional regulator [Victivallaceae bacterium]|nr:GntR family transcriptional regulator [Victivallaceae bacterium]
MQIRHYVMGLTLQAGNSAIKLPPLRILEKQLNVSLGTLVSALQELAKDGYLTARKGIGYFTRPSMLDIPFDAPSPKMIGVLINEGKNFYFGNSTYLAAPALFEEFRVRQWRLHLRSLEGHNGDECFREICSWRCDALLWVTPDRKLLPMIDQLLAAGLPILTQSAKLASTSSVAFDFGKPLRKIGSELGSRALRKVLVCLPPERAGMTQLGKGIADCSAHTQLSLFDPAVENAGQKLIETLSAFDGELVICESRCLHLVEKFRQEHARTFRILRPLQYFSEDGIIYNYLPDYRKFAAASARELERLLEGNSEVRHTVIDGAFSAYTAGDPVYSL